MMIKVVIWGLSETFKKYYGRLQELADKGVLCLVAAIDGSYDKGYINGISIIRKEEITAYEFDYLLIMAEKSYSEIFDDAIELGVENWRIIRARVFENPTLDFERYIISRKARFDEEFNRIEKRFSTKEFNIEQNGKTIHISFEKYNFGNYICCVYLYNKCIDIIPLYSKTVRYTLKDEGYYRFVIQRNEEVKCNIDWRGIKYFDEKTGELYNQFVEQRSIERFEGTDYYISKYQ